MCTEMDFRDLWNKQEPNDMPNTNELLKKADRLRKKFRFKLIIQTVILMAAIAITLGAGLSIDHRQLTTNIGLALMVLGIILYIITTNQLLPILYKSSIAYNSHEYLKQLISIKRNSEFMQKVMINVYFCLLATGLFLYLMQFAMQMKVVEAVLCYLIPFACLGVAYAHAKRTEFRKILIPLNDTIKKLEAVNAQLGNVDE